jgi:hypothetical protein
MKSNTLKDSWNIVKFYETTRIFFNQHLNQLMDDYENEMVRRSPEHQMDFEEYCLVVVLFMFSSKPRKTKTDKLFESEAKDLVLYYQNNYKTIKKTWNREVDNFLFEWVLTSYDRHKADSRPPLSLSSFLNK